ncbi:MAG TPA: ATP-grasp fold amidoligase family protein [Rhizomicrobium sp.]
MRVIKQTIKSIFPEIALDVVQAARSYRKVHGVFPNLFFPSTFNEKVMARSLFDTRPILRQFADKYAVREYVSKRLGGDFLPELYWVTRSPRDIPFNRLPGSFVAKPTHGAGWVRLVRDKAALDRSELVRQCDYWLAQNFYKRHRERVYKDIVPRILIEELIGDGGEAAPTDYKFMVFHGRVEMVCVIAGRFVDTRGYFLDRDWNMLEAGLVNKTANIQAAPQPGGLPRPPHFEEMIRAAEILAKGMDFVRVDFYDTPKKIYFGELTTTPGAGLASYQPADFDAQLGRLW